MTNDVPYQFLCNKLQASAHTGTAPIDRYLAQLRVLYTQYHTTPSDNPKLVAYRRERQLLGPLKTIDLTESSTRLKAHIPAVEAAANAAMAKVNEMQAPVLALKIARDATRDRMRALQKIDDVCTPLTQQGAPIRSTVEHAIIVFSSALSGLTESEARRCVNAWQQEKQRVPHPAISQHFRDFLQADGLSSTPQGPFPRPNALMHELVELAAFISRKRLQGGIPGLEGLEQTLLRQTAELENAQDHHDLADHSVHTVALFDSTIKPAIGDMLEQLHGIPKASINPEYLCLHKRHASKIIDAALRTITPPQQLPGSAAKALLSFSLAWDGFKAMHGDYGMQAGIVPGPVNAAALERYLQEKIVQTPGASLQEARDAVQQKVGALILNIPENPTGTMPSATEMAALAAVIAKYQLPMVVVDEIFAAPGYRSLSTYPDMAQRCFVVGGTSKNFNSEPVLAFGYTQHAATAKAVQHQLGAEHAISPAEAAGFGGLLSTIPRQHFEDNQRIYAEKRALVGFAMERVNRKLGIPDGMAWLKKPDYGCLGVLKISPQLVADCGLQNSCQLAEYIYAFSGVKTIPTGDVEAHPDHPMGVRINYSGDDKQLTQAIDRIGIALAHMQERTPCTLTTQQTQPAPAAKAQGRG